MPLPATPPAPVPGRRDGGVAASTTFVKVGVDAGVPGRGVGVRCRPTTVVVTTGVCVPPVVVGDGVALRLVVIVDVAVGVLVDDAIGVTEP